MRPSPESVWPAIVEAFAFYGKRVGPIRGERRRMVKRLLDEGYTGEDLVAAIHGYVAHHDGLEAKDEFNPRKYFKPDSVFRIHKLDDRIDLGIDGPWRKPMSREETVKARQQAARERVAAARRAQEEPRLRAVQEG